MRINKFVAQATGMSRRDADELVKSGKISVNGSEATLGTEVSSNDVVTLGSQQIKLQEYITIMLNKPNGYVCSRDGQGSKTIYDLLPNKYHNLKPVGRLDKDSSGLLLMTNDGQLSQELTHPSQQKEKIYQVELDKPLEPDDKSKIEQGIKLNDGLSALKLNGKAKKWTVKMYEGRNRQIRRTFAALDYKIIKLNRTQFGPYKLNSLRSSELKLID